MPTCFRGLAQRLLAAGALAILAATLAACGPKQASAAHSESDTLSTAPGTPTLAVNPTITATPTVSQGGATRVASYGHVFVAVPPGWTTGQPRPCTHVSEHKVTLGPLGAVARCPYPPDASTGISVVFGQSAFVSSPPASARWDGQPAQATSTTNTGPDASGTSSPVSIDTVNLPLLGAYITTQAGTPAEAAALLDRVSVHPATSIELPAAASSLEVSIVATARPPKPSVVTTTDAALIAPVLQALRAAPLLPASTPICNPDAASPIALLTVPGRPTIQIGLSNCNEVIAGNGTLAQVTPQLRAALPAIIGTGRLG